MIDNRHIQELRELTYKKHYVQVTSATLNALLDEIVTHREKEAHREGERIGRLYHRQVASPQRHSKTRYDRDTILSLLNEGYSAREVAEVAGCSTATVYNLKNGVA